MARRLLAALVAALTLTAFLTAPARAAGGAVFPKDIISTDFPDPDVFEQNGTWYAYSTNSGLGTVPVATAPSPDGPWTIRGDAMPDGPSSAWAQLGRTWAPDVYPNPDGTYTLTYAAWHKETGRQCIGVATATSPLGPFTPVGTTPLICPLDQGGAIDPNTFVAKDGTRYLVWKNEGNAVGKPSTLWLTRTTNDGQTLVGGNTALLTSNGIIEAPDLVQRDSRYVLFFSSSGYNNCNYQTSYATATSLTGPWTTAFRPLMTTDTFDGHVCGPGGANFVGDKVFVHGWVDGARHLFEADLGWANDLPIVRGSRVRIEGESGQLNHCVVRSNAAGASDGKVVAYIDYPDSWVEESMYAPVAGDYTLHIGYANGSRGTASHGLVVNGNSQGTVSYPATGWDNWHESSVPVVLKAGWNTVRLTKGRLYTEVDYLEMQ
ncbi:family 43 glycosylhydrolase [Kribbella sp. NPDC026611]|uniref:family 43 glycosylhydrolase n=1 Tax=Kribbella sp. NPDC026611 TaxID=3154911 RepID=UPI0033CEDA5A